MTTAPAASTAAPASEVQENVAWGKFVAQFITNESPFASMLLTTFVTHLVPAPLQFFIPAGVIGDAIKTVMASLSANVINQSVSFSVPHGLLADVVSEVIAALPNFLAGVEKYVDPDIRAALTALGVLPKG